METMEALWPMIRMLLVTGMVAAVVVVVTQYAAKAASRREQVRAADAYARRFAEAEARQSGRGGYCVNCPGPDVSHMHQVAPTPPRPVGQHREKGETRDLREHAHLLGHPGSDRWTGGDRKDSN